MVNAKNFFKTEKDKKIFAQVFDFRTLNVIQELANKGWFYKLEHIISTGKEAHVFKAVDVNGEPRAVKIYKIETSLFKNMMKYIEGDIRFSKVKKDKQDIVFTWAKKEFKNLSKARDAGIQCPSPLAFKENVLVMKFLGNEDAAPLLREVRLSEEEKISVYNQIIENVAKLFFKADLIHADLSEYNMIYWNEKVYFIDFGQGVLRNHPKAKEFFENDVKNLTHFFRKLGLNKNLDQVFKEIKACKQK